MLDAPTLPGLPPPPDPPQDRSGRQSPPATVALLILLQVLLVYARHLLDTLALLAQRGITLIARYFGSTQAAFVLTNLTSGILRAIALERVLLAHAGGQPAGGEPDPAASKPRNRASQAARQEAAQQPSGPHPARPEADQRPGLPTLRQLEAAIRRRPVACVIDDIRHDFGVSFSMCEPRFGNALRDVIAAYRDTVANFFKEHLGREAIAADAPKRNLSSDSPPQKPDAIRYIVGLFGAEPICGFPFTAPPVAAASAGAQPP